jgi:hypothetical protein
VGKEGGRRLASRCPHRRLGFRVEAINADDQPPRTIFDAKRRVLSLTRRPYPRKPSCRKASVRPIRALRQGAGTGLPALLLGSKKSWCRLGRTGVSPFSLQTPKTLSGPLWGAPVEMLLHASFGNHFFTPSLHSIFYYVSSLFNIRMGRPTRLIHNKEVR